MIPASKPDEPRAQQLEQELDRQTGVVEQARADATLFTGSRVAPRMASVVAAEEGNLAMLRQHFLLAKYGLAFPTPTPNAR